MINLTDHAFWLGKYCADYFIEFRAYGYNVSTKFRGLPAEKLLMQSYYPIKDGAAFCGFPVETNNKIILFTGGTYYKMYGESGKFFELVKKILTENPQVILLIAGGGDVKPMNNFIRKNSFEKRVILLGNRSDINEIFKRIDVCLATYPITGALMAQYAVEYHKNIIGYSTADIQTNFLEGILSTPPDITLTYTVEEEFHKEMNKLLQSKIYRDEKAKALSHSVISGTQFNIDLKELVSTNISLPAQNLIIDRERFFQLYLETENNFLHTYYQIIYKHIANAIFYNPLLALRFLIDTALNHKSDTIEFVSKKFQNRNKM